LTREPEAVVLSIALESEKRDAQIDTDVLIMVTTILPISKTNADILNKVLRRLQVTNSNQWDAFGEKAFLLQRSTIPTLLPEDLELSIHPLASQEGILVKVEPPTSPPDSNLSHVPCDIVLVIDVSWSMCKAAPLVGLDHLGAVTKEHAGYSVLDITKHAALTVLETLNERDRLGIVTFSTTAKVTAQRREDPNMGKHWLTLSW
jgi:hypothetical protein